jgi:hypothetical protein
LELLFDWQLLLHTEKQTHARDLQDILRFRVSHPLLLKRIISVAGTSTATVYGFREPLDFFVLPWPSRRADAIRGVPELQLKGPRYELPLAS